MIKTEHLDINKYTQLSKFNELNKIKGVEGILLNIVGKAVKVKDETTNETFFIKIDDILSKLIGQDRSLSKEGKETVKRRILEIADSDTRQPVSFKKLQELFINYTRDKIASKTPLETESQIIDELDKIKLIMSGINLFAYKDRISEIANKLQPGDIIIRKWYDKHDNYICDLQKFFPQNGLRDAHRCSHVTIYLGQIKEGKEAGKHWIAEASMPHGKEAQIRRITVDDPRFLLTSEKNQYLVFRNNNKENAQESAKLARQYCYKLLPEDEMTPSRNDLEGGLQYNYVEAGRSMWHSQSLGLYGTHRLFKHYADYQNGIPFEYLGQQRSFFCSHFAMLMESLGEMKTSREFNAILEKNPIPKVYDQSKTGMDLQVSKLWYSIRKGVWSRWMALKYHNEVKKSIPTHLDALRTAPQNVVNYMLDHKNQFTLVGAIVHEGDYTKAQVSADNIPAISV